MAKDDINRHKHDPLLMSTIPCLAWSPTSDARVIPASVCLGRFLIPSSLPCPNLVLHNTCRGIPSPSLGVLRRRSNPSPRTCPVIAMPRTAGSDAYGSRHHCMSISDDVVIHAFEMPFQSWSGDMLGEDVCLIISPFCL